MTELYERLQGTAAVLAERTGCEQHDVVVVLGSGLGAYPDRIGDKVAVSYRDLRDSRSRPRSATPARPTRRRWATTGC